MKRVLAMVLCVLAFVMPARATEDELRIDLELQGNVWFSFSAWVPRDLSVEHGIYATVPAGGKVAACFNRAYVNESQAIEGGSYGSKSPYQHQEGYPSDPEDWVTVTAGHDGDRLFVAGWDYENDPDYRPRASPIGCTGGSRASDRQGMSRVDHLVAAVADVPLEDVSVWAVFPPGSQIIETNWGNEAGLFHREHFGGTQVYAASGTVAGLAHAGGAVEATFQNRPFGMLWSSAAAAPGGASMFTIHEPDGSTRIRTGVSNSLRLNADGSIRWESHPHYSFEGPMPGRYRFELHAAAAPPSVTSRADTVFAFVDPVFPDHWVDPPIGTPPL